MFSPAHFKLHELTRSQPPLREKQFNGGDAQADKAALRIIRDILSSLMLGGPS